MQNVSNQDGKMKFVEVTNEGALLELYTQTVNSSVPVAGGLRVPVVTQRFSLQGQKDVSCSDTQCTKSFIGNGVKIEYTIERGDSAAALALLDRAMEIVALARASYNADQGMQPPVFATFPAV